MPEVRERRPRYPHLVRIRVSDRLLSSIEERAREQDRSLSAVVRALLGSGLRQREQLPDVALGVATLIAAEHTRLVVQSILPEGRRVADLEADAALAAERRLAETRAALEAQR